MNDNSNNKMVDIKEFVSDDNPAQAITNFIRFKIKECIFVSDQEHIFYLSSYINRTSYLRWVQLSQIQPDFGNLESSCITPKMLNDFFTIVELQLHEYKNLEAKNCVFVDIKMDLNEVVSFKGYFIWIFSSKTIIDVLKSNNESLDDYNIKLN